MIGAGADREGTATESGSPALADAYLVACRIGGCFLVPALAKARQASVAASRAREQGRRLGNDHWWEFPKPKERTGGNFCRGPDQAVPDFSAAIFRAAAGVRVPWRAAAPAVPRADARRPRRSPPDPPGSAALAPAGLPRPGPCAAGRAAPRPARSRPVPFSLSRRSRGSRDRRPPSTAPFGRLDHASPSLPRSISASRSASVLIGCVTRACRQLSGRPVPIKSD